MVRSLIFVEWPASYLNFPYDSLIQILLALSHEVDQFLSHWAHKSGWSDGVDLCLVVKYFEFIDDVQLDPRWQNLTQPVRPGRVGPLTQC